MFYGLEFYLRLFGGGGGGSGGGGCGGSFQLGAVSYYQPALAA